MTIDPEEVHVWRVRTDVPCDAASLDASERARAARLLREEDRLRFTAAHVALRALLGRVLGTEPGEVRFVEGPHGKPSLASGGPIRFNLSHSGDLALVAVASGRELGVDLERHGPVAIEDLAARYFSEAEARALAALPPDARRPAFFRCWSRKEAFLKACGSGMTLPLKSFDVSIEATGPVALVTRPPAPDAAGYRIESLEIDADHAAALAFERRPGEVVRVVDRGSLPADAAAP